MKFFKVTSIFFLIYFAVISFSFAGTRQDNKRTKRNTSTEVVSINRILAITMEDNRGEQVAYEIVDMAEGEKEGDGVIDFANIIKFIHEPGSSMTSLFSVGTKFPIRAKFAYFRPGNELSNVDAFSLDEWLGGFHAKIVECMDADNQWVSPVGVEWKTYTVKKSLMNQLQKLYDDHY